jgi:glycosyltransferase involved in cell wall biosynthesis
MWFDLPAEKASTKLKGFLRDLYYFFLRTSHARVFCVGKNTVQYFKKRGFSDRQLVDLPIFIDVGGRVEEYRQKRDVIRAKYRVTKEGLFIVTGSRLIHEKGFDLLIKALSFLSEEVRRQVTLLIVGKGPERPALEQQVVEQKLDGSVYFEAWMDPEDFMAHLGAADLAVHPARFDAYGGITLGAMIAGLPVVASDQAGSAVDRIEPGVNGWLYPAMDISQMAHWLNLAFQDREALKAMGLSARQTAEKYRPEAGARFVMEKLV